LSASTLESSEVFAFQGFYIARAQICCVAIPLALPIAKNLANLTGALALHLVSGVFAIFKAIVLPTI
jgi:hypothetical protein